MPATPSRPGTPQPAPPRVPLSTIPHAQTLPNPPPPAALPISSQQLQLFQGPMGTTRGPAAPELLYDPPPLLPEPINEPEAPPRSARRGKIMAALMGAVAGLVGGSIVVEAGRMVGAAQRTTPIALEGPAAARPWKRYDG